MATSLGRRNALGLIVGGTAVLWAIVTGNRSYKVPEVSIEQVKALVEAGAMVIDVRSREAFNSRHLPTAMLFPLAVLRAGVPLILNAAKSKQIVVYCNDGVTSGPEATHLLLEAGFTKVVNMKSGIEGWEAAGLQVAKA